MVNVSVIMGSYNHERYIAQAIESVLNQTVSDLELIVVDDYSKDSSPQIIEHYMQKDPRVKAVFHSKNMGIAKGMNDGLNAAQGRYLGFIGSDDMWMPNKLERQLPVIQRHPDKVLWSQGIIINGEGLETGQLMTDLLFSPPTRDGNLFELLLYEDFIFGQSALFKTEYAKEIAFNENLRYVNDHLFFVELAKKHEFLYMPQVLAKYRLHGKNTTLHNMELWFRERIMLRNYLLEKYGSMISRRTLADLYYKIGHAYAGLNQKENARSYYLKALRADPVRAHSLLFLILALTNGEGSVGETLKSSYSKVTAGLSQAKN